MTLIVDINHWLVGDDLPDGPPRLRRNALRIVRFIEYGGPLPQLHGRETLIQCKRRPGGKACDGWMWVVKQNDNRIQVHCPTCHEVEAIISGWEETLWGRALLAEAERALGHLVCPKVNLQVFPMN